MEIRETQNDQQLNDTRLDPDSIYHKKIKRSKLSVFKEAQELREIMRGENVEESNRARHKLIENNLGLITTVIDIYFSNLPKGFEKDDLKQIGSKGLIRAVDKFNPKKGYEFSTYACTAILNAIRGAIKDIETDKRRILHHQASIDSKLDVQDKNSLSPIDNLNIKEKREKLKRALGKLDTDSQKIISMLYGLEPYELKPDEGEYTITRIAQELGLTRNKVFRLKHKALRELLVDNPELEDLISE